MNEWKWTKGPWIAPFSSYVVAKDTLSKICQLDGIYVKNPNSQADSNLIAAAPDLYEALEEANNVIRDLAVCYLKTLPDGDERGFFPLYDRMKSALAKARGEA